MSLAHTLLVFCKICKDTTDHYMSHLLTADQVIYKCPLCGSSRQFSGSQIGANLQPPPKPNDSRPVWDLVIQDMRTRDHNGRAKYGVPLQARNGRDALQDAYEEALDLAVYLKQAIIERDSKSEATR